MVDIPVATWPVGCAIGQPQENGPDLRFGKFSCIRFAELSSETIFSCGLNGGGYGLKRLSCRCKLKAIIKRPSDIHVALS